MTAEKTKALILMQNELEALTRAKIPDMIIDKVEDDERRLWMRKRLTFKRAEKFHDVMHKMQDLHENFFAKWTEGGYPDIPDDKRDEINAYYAGVALFAKAVRHFFNQAAGLGMFSESLLDIAVTTATQAASTCAILEAETGLELSDTVAIDALMQVIEKGLLLSLDDKKPEDAQTS